MDEEVNEEVRLYLRQYLEDNSVWVDSCMFDIGNDILSINYSSIVTDGKMWSSEKNNFISSISGFRVWRTTYLRALKLKQIKERCLILQH